MFRRACITLSGRRLPVQLLDYATSDIKYCAHIPHQSRTFADASITEITINMDDVPKKTKRRPPPRKNTKFKNNSKKKHTSKRDMHRSKKPKWGAPQDNNELFGASTEWVAVTNIPPLSKLEDLLVDVERIMATEQSVGIVDLDAAERMLQQNMESSESLSGKFEPPQAVPIWEPDESLPSHLVLEAHLMLSTLLRPNGWYLRFPNRSCVHALISHIREARINGIEGRRQVNIMRGKESEKLRRKPTDENESNDLEEIPDFSYKMVPQRPLRCAWKEVLVNPFFPDEEDKMHEGGYNPFLNKWKWTIDDTVIRVENCCRHATPYEVGLLFSRYDLLDERCSDLEVVEQIVFAKTASESFTRKNDESYTPSATTAFLVRFNTAADARAALREKQNVEFMGRRLMLAQFPRQILGTTSNS